MRLRGSSWKYKRQRRLLFSFECIAAVVGTLLVCNLMALQRLRPSTEAQERLSSDSTIDRVKKILQCKRMRSYEDMKGCFSSNELRKPLYDNCDTISTWKDVQRCINGRYASPEDKIREIHVIGERNSGTKFVMTELQKCFRSIYNVKVHRDLIRSKHFFQPLVRGDRHKSLVVAIFRNPIDWTWSMRMKPYHSPNHLQGFAQNETHDPIPLSWYEFVNRTWSMPRSLVDNELIREGKDKTTDHGTLCREGFPFNEVVPCRYDRTSIPENRVRGYEPIYELRRDGSGRPFSNILQLRSQKIVNMLLQVPLILEIGGYLSVRYEDLLTQGSSDLLASVADMLQMSGALRNCTPSPPQTERLGHWVVDPDFRKFVEAHSILDTEALLDYL